MKHWEKLMNNDDLTRQLMREIEALQAPMRALQAAAHPPLLSEINAIESGVNASIRRIEEQVEAFSRATMEQFDLLAHTATAQLAAIEEHSSEVLRASEAQYRRLGDAAASFSEGDTPAFLRIAELYRHQTHGVAEEMRRVSEVISTISASGSPGVFREIAAHGDRALSAAKALRPVLGRSDQPLADAMRGVQAAQAELSRVAVNAPAALTEPPGAELGYPSAVGSLMAKVTLERLNSTSFVFEGAPEVIWRGVENVQKIWEIWEETDRKLAEKAPHLAELGWTIPMHLAAPEILELVTIDNSEQVDEIIIASYASDNEEALEALRRDLGSSRLLATWRSLLDQCFLAYRNGHNAICVPGLLTVLEGAISQLGSIRSTLSRSERKALFDDIKHRIPQPSMLLYIVISIAAFLEHLYQQAPFGEKRPVTINRHWILHGRDKPDDWSRGDALRLFQALHAISLVDSMLDREKPNDPPN
jgi:hypothetical protein